MRAAPYRAKNPANDPDKVFRAIAANMAARRESLGMYQEKVARLARISQATVARIEKNSLRPNLRMICRLADVLGTTAMALMQPGTFGDAKRAS